MSASLSENLFDRINRLQAKLNQKLGPEYISQRPGPGGGAKLTYAEGWKVINIANEVFGYEGWSSQIINMTTDYMDFNEESRRYNVGVSVILRVTLREGVSHEDVGYGMIENAKSKGMALDKCKKEAVTDALKRTLRTYGNVLGNCLYDKQYTTEVVKIKVPPIKFDKDNLHLASTSYVSTSTNAPPQQQQKWQPQPKQEPPKPPPQQPKPIVTSTTTDRKVSFAAAPAKTEPVPVTLKPAVKPAQDDDDDYGFSDDDAFLSTVDLGEGDLGRPIDFEEGLLGGTVLEEQEQAEAERSMAAPVLKAEERYGPMGLGRTGTGSTTTISRPAAPATHQPQHGNMAPPPPPANANRSTSGAPQQRPVSAWPAPVLPNASSSGSRVANPAPPAPVRQRPPSMGGFHFPPGMEDALLNQNRNPNQPPPHMSLKRTADAMMCERFFGRLDQEWVSAPRQAVRDSLLGRLHWIRSYRVGM
ncbi:hypothetical protein C8F01DRAFT_1255927 [Mycena amicta]|nr:hypothetical protein C8F01DRAFT_1255927 [Mycena amicta]